MMKTLVSLIMWSASATAIYLLYGPLVGHLSDVWRAWWLFMIGFANVLLTRQIWNGQYWGGYHADDTRNRLPRQRW